MSREWVWIFTGDRTGICSGAFDNRAAAEDWITSRGLSGLLLRIPLNCGIYDWACTQGKFESKGLHHQTADFIGNFSSAYLEHYHYENGRSRDRSEATEGYET